MQVTPSQVKWGSYSPSKGTTFSGPMYLGSIPYKMPDDPAFDDKLVQVITSIESGTYDAINMYDSCILTVGVIQLCEKLFFVTNMLGECARTDLDYIQSMLGQLPTPASLQKNSRNEWRITFGDDQVVASPAEMRTLYLGGASGIKSEWTDEQKEHAIKVATTFASMWDSSSMQAGQMRYIKSRLMSFVGARSKKLLFDLDGQDEVIGALKAAVLSYAINLPAVADRAVFQASQDPAWNQGDTSRFFCTMRAILNQKVAIWPARYKRIYPVLQELFDVDIPSLQELGLGHSDDHDEEFGTTLEIQEALIKLGYDLGPKGADGVEGPKTRNAIIAFQVSHRDKDGKPLFPDGVIGGKTREALRTALAQV